MTHRRYTIARFEENLPGANYSPEEVEYLLAVENYQRRTHRKFLLFTEFLAIAKAMGYRRPEYPDPSSKNLGG